MKLHKNFKFRNRNRALFEITKEGKDQDGWVCKCGALEIELREEFIVEMIDAGTFIEESILLQKDDLEKYFPFSSMYF